MSFSRPEVRIACLAAAILLVAALVPGVLAPTPAHAQTVLLVTSNADSGPGSLRDAIAQANTDVTSDTILFASDMTIQVLSPYGLTENYPCAIDAETHNVVLDCSGVPGVIASECILVTTSNNLINGLKIINMPGANPQGVGIRFQNTSGNQVTNCYLGTADGVTAAGNDTGIALENCQFPWTQIGALGEGNVISGNRTCGIRVAGGSQMTIQANRIGTTADGTAALGNGTYGVYLENTSLAAINSNTVSANANQIYMTGQGNGAVISGNHVGTNSTGTAVLSDPQNDYGIYLSNSAYATIGGNNAASRNIISGLAFGVYVNDDAGATSIVGNYIGTDETGSNALGIGLDGVVVRNQGSAVGNIGQESGNVISGAALANVWVGGSASEVRVQSNLIGLNAAGTAALGHSQTGVYVMGTGCFIGWPYGIIAPAPGKRGAIGSSSTGGNVIAGARYGLDVDSSTNTTVQSNYFGTSASGTAAIPNEVDVLIDSDNTTVGGTNPDEGNLISGATDRGIYIRSGTGTRVYQNLIGTDAAGTGAIPNGLGIEVIGSGCTIGGEASGQQNTIAHNQGTGVFVTGSGASNTIAANSIYANGALGIDLFPPGPNVPQPDFPYPTAGQPNLYMHFPVIAKATSDEGHLTVAGTAAPSSTVRVFFSDGGTTAYGQGKIYVGKTAASASGAFSLDASPASLATKSVTATATDAQGNTSEFALNAPITTPDRLSTVYYLAEGYTANNTFYPGEFFDTYILVQNPSSKTADITATFMRNAGKPNVVGKYTVAPHSRFTINVDQVPGLEASDVSSKIECTNGVGIAVERSMYFNYYGKTGGSSSVAAAAPSKTWYFAEGDTANNFDTWLLLQNPGAKDAACTVTFMDEHGNVSRPTYRVSAHTRYTVEVNKVPGFASNQVSMSVTSDQPVVAERSMYFDYCGWADGGHNSVGAPAPATTWYLPEGYTVQNPCRFDTWVLLENPGNARCEVEATYMTNFDNVVKKNYVIDAHSRYTVKLNDIAGLKGTDVSTCVRSTNRVPFVAERSSYFDYYGMTDGSNSAGSPARHSSWYVPEGYQSDTFHTYILVENPNERQITCDFSFMAESGKVVNESFTVPPTSRFTVGLDQVGMANTGVATQVTTSRDTPIVVEKATYFVYNDINGGASSMGIGVR